MMDLIVKAAKQADIWHAGQVRKYTNRPYITHPARVAHAVAVSNVGSAVTVAAAYLHDTIEDCGVVYSDLYIQFGHDVADIVIDLTNTSKVDIPKASRKERKAYDLRKIAMIPQSSKVIKMLDRIDNLGEYPLDNDEATKFLKQVYLDESYSLYQVVKDADEQLAYRLLTKINEVSEQIGGMIYERGDR
jgi:(p)ppGpp synthase/HD superfamily hydrolase